MNNIRRFYDFDGKPINTEEWLKLQEKRIVKQEFVNLYLISTVWTGINLGYDMFTNMHLIYETMIFDRRVDHTSFKDIYVDRYATKEEAENGHKNAKRWLQEYISKEVKNKGRHFVE